MSKNVIFSLTINYDSVPSNVSLYVDGKDPIGMKQVQNNIQNHIVIYEIALLIKYFTTI